MKWTFISSSSLKIKPFTMLKEWQACRNTDVTSILISLCQILHYGVHMELVSFPSVTECVSTQWANSDPDLKLHWQDKQSWDHWCVMANLATRI